MELLSIVDGGEPRDARQPEGVVLTNFAPSEVEWQGSGREAGRWRVPCLSPREQTIRGQWH